LSEFKFKIKDAETNEIKLMKYQCMYGTIKRNLKQYRKLNIL